jgi:hypothetical protein
MPRNIGMDDSVTTGICGVGDCVVVGDGVAVGDGVMVRTSVGVIDSDGITVGSVVKVWDGDKVSRERNCICTPHPDRNIPVISRNRINRLTEKNRSFFIRGYGMYSSKIPARRYRMS